jgi:hypothetical protein
MIETEGDLWEINADARCITTNGIIKKNGDAVMGAGLAKEAAIRYPQLPLLLGSALFSAGNRVHLLLPMKQTDWHHNWLVSFPTKNDWKDKSDMDLIAKSCKELVRMSDNMRWRKVLLPRVGCGLGQLSWDDVRVVLEEFLDNRFVVVSG